MRPTLFAALLVLAGCNPVAYVPAPVPAAPASAGVRASAGLNALGSQATASLDVAPVAGLGLYARGLYANTLSSETAAGAYVNRGAEVGVVGSVPMSDHAALELGLFTGRDRVRATDFSYDIGCCSTSYYPVTLETRRTGGHIALISGRADSRGTRRRVGPAVRLTRAEVFREREDGFAPDGVGVFIEPAVRFEVATDRSELTFFIGASVEIGEGFEGYTHVPLTAGAAAAVPLNRLW